MPNLAEGEFARIKEQLETSLELSGQPVKRGTMAHTHIVYMMLVDAASKARELETILKYAPVLEELAVRDNHQSYLAICHRSFGVAYSITKEFEKAENRLEQALEIFVSMGLNWQTGRTLAELGKVAELKNERSKALDLYGKARDLFESIQAKPDMEKMEIALAESNLP